MRWQRLMWQLWPWRWARSLRALLRHARVHPSVVVLGPFARTTFGRGVVIGARARVDLRDSGHLTMGDRVWLASDVEVETSTQVSIGDGTTVQRRASINGSVRIGRGCILAPNVFVSSGTHPFRHVPHLPIRQQESLLATSLEDRAALDRPVWVQDDCWLGVNAVVSPGVTVGKGSIVGANAVVTHDVAPYSVVGGVPARAISRRLLWRPPMTLRADRAADLAYVLSGRTGFFRGRAALVLTLAEPLRIVLACTTEHIRIEYAAPRGGSVSVAGQRLDIRAGEGSIDVRAAAPRPRLPETVVDIQMVPADDVTAGAHELYIFQVECL